MWRKVNIVTLCNLFSKIRTKLQSGLLLLLVNINMHVNVSYLFQYNGVEFYRTYADTTHSSDDQRSEMM